MAFFALLRIIFSSIMFFTSVVTLTKREGAVLKIMGRCYNHLARGDCGEILRNPKAIGVRAFLYTPE